MSQIIKVPKRFEGATSEPDGGILISNPNVEIRNFP